VSTERRGLGRVYLYPVPKDGPHPGYRGHLLADALGVHLDTSGEYLYIPDDEPHEWELLELAVTIPWPRINSIEWEEASPNPAPTRGPRC
jgi:hypothetical protein